MPINYLASTGRHKKQERRVIDEMRMTGTSVKTASVLRKLTAVPCCGTCCCHAFWYKGRWEQWRTLADTWIVSYGLSEVHCLLSLHSSTDQEWNFHWHLSIQCKDPILGLFGNGPGTLMLLLTIMLTQFLKNKTELTFYIFFNKQYTRQENTLIMA